MILHETYERYQINLSCFNRWIALCNEATQPQGCMLLVQSRPHAMCCSSCSLMMLHSELSQCAGAGNPVIS